MDGLAVGLHPVGPLLLRHLVVQSHLLQRDPVAKDHPAAVQIRGHIRLIIFDKQPVMQDIDCTERVIALKHRRIEPVLPDPDCGIRSSHGTLYAAPAHTLPKISNHLGSLHADLSVAKGLIADHMFRIGTALPGTHTFPVHASVNIVW